MPPRLLYTSFDQVPGPKGAGTHIEANARGLGRHYGSLVLVTPGPEDRPVRPVAPGVRQVVLGCPDDNLIGRALTFRVKLLALLREQPFDVIHFRSIFEGYPLALHKAALGARLLYEANGFPSVELKYHYPRLLFNDALQAKLRQQEAACLTAADQVVTVSRVSRAFVERRGVAGDKIRVLANGVDGQVFSYQAPPRPDGGPLRLLYVGTLAAWQGVETLLRAVALVKAVRTVALRLVGPSPRERRAEVERLVEQLGLAADVELLGTRDQEAVARLLHEAHAAVVPLAAVDRNTQQGCCPLKVLEAMAAGCPVIASDLPVVRELAEPEIHFLPARPDDAASLQEAVLRLVESPNQVQEMARQARDHVSGRFSWEQSVAGLVEVYEALLSRPANTSANKARSRSSE